MKRRCRSEHLDGDAPDAHVIADGQTAETFGRTYSGNCLTHVGTRIRDDTSTTGL